MKCNLCQFSCFNEQVNIAGVFTETVRLWVNCIKFVITFTTLFYSQADVQCGAPEEKTVAIYIVIGK